ncbi:MAG: nucleotide exchange factor GrpE [Puniceicoccales bacterium]|jgi:molecular chaperone GrpE|nr:nucleotide exchange factor GrpE [Puniceicoccales bacterium]
MEKEDLKDRLSDESFFSDKKNEKNSSEELKIPQKLEEKSTVDETKSDESAAEKKYLAAYVQLQADFENFKKRSAKEREEWTKMATRHLIEELLTVVDHLDLAMQSAHPDDEKSRQIVQGFAMIVEQLKKLLSQHGLSEVGQLGELFNPQLHEAVAQAAHATIPPDHICQIVRVGYQLHDLVLRPASVMVSTGPDAKMEAKERSL